MSDIRALLLTDVVDSTELAQRIGDDAMSSLWTNHDRVARDLLRTWRGREIDKTDGMLTLFASPADAIGYALAYHRSLAALDIPLKARAGLHVGPVSLRENTPADVALGAKPLEVDGIAKPTVARVMMIAQAGQTLLTAEARQALGDAGGQLHPYGYWRAKGIAEPFEVFEIADSAAPGLVAPSSAPKAYRVVRDGDLWLPVDRVPRNLPAQRDAFVGRTAALDDLARRLRRGARLISIVGIGGCGKTRLAARLAWDALGDFPGGAWFCDLSLARDVDGIVHAVADALDVPLGKEDPIVQLGNAMAGRGKCLIILDNFEQVSRLSNDTLGRWLGRTLQSHFIVTTREVLGLRGEEILSLAPLEPMDAQALFMLRAAAASNTQPTAEDRSAIAPLVALLDGLPLAIELAAARARVMPPRTLLARMSDRFKLLSTSRGKRDRQATLRATFDWSWDLLTEVDKAALAQLSVFEGGFTLESAAAVLDLGRYADAPWTIDVVQSLVDKSFVRVAGGQRFDLLDTVQEYAAEQLRTVGRYPGSGPDASAHALARHGAHFAALSEEQAIADACIELKNLVTACRRAISRGEAAVAADTLRGAWAAIRLRGPFRLGVDLASGARSMVGIPASALARVHQTAGNAFQVAGRVAEARAALADALVLARQTKDRLCEAHVLVHLGKLNANEGRMDEARRESSAALALARDLRARDVECDALNELGTALEYLGHLDQARAHYEDALRVAREAGDRHREGGTLGNIGSVYANQGLLAEAEKRIEASLGIAREIGDRQWEGNALCNLGLLHHVQGKLGEAREQLGAALDVARAIGHTRLDCIASCNLGMVFVALDNPNDGQASYEAALNAARELADRRTEGQILNYLGLLHAQQHRLDEARRCLEAGEALLLAVSDRMGLALLLCSRAEAEQHAGSIKAARDAIDRAEALALELGAGPQSELGQSLARARGVVQRAV